MVAAASLPKLYDAVAQPKQNCLLGGLSPAEYARWLPDLELVHLPVGESRDHLMVVDRQELESRAGERYAVVSKAYQSRY
ncbi:MAG: hypothetical protein ABI167_00780 [Nitrosospira sp.]